MTGQLSTGQPEGGQPEGGQPEGGQPDAGQPDTGQPGIEHAGAEPRLKGRLWRNRSWRWLCSAVVVSVMGDLLASVAVAEYLLERGSSRWLAGYFVAFIVCRMLVAAPLGKLADRWNRVTMLVTADIVRLAIFIVLAVALANDAPPWAPLVAIGLSSAATAGARAAYVALIPMIVDDDLLADANAAEAACHQAGWLAGPVVGAAVASVWGAPVAVAANAATFAVSALLISRVHPNRSPQVVQEPEPVSVAASGAESIGGAAWPETTVIPVAFDPEGARRTTLTVWALTVVGAGVLFLFGAEMVTQPLVVEQVLRRNVSQVGWLIAAAGAAGLLTAPVASRLLARLGSWPTLWGSTIVAGACIAGLGYASQIGVAMAIAAVGGAAGMMFEVSVMTAIQHAVADDAIGSVVGRFDSIGAAATLLGVVSVPVLTALVDLRTAGLMIGVAVLLMVAASIALQRRPADVRVDGIPVAAISELRFHQHVDLDAEGG
jgi:predicted MFS family arabinose efflux permease